MSNEGNCDEWGRVWAREVWGCIQESTRGLCIGKSVDWGVGGVGGGGGGGGGGGVGVPESLEPPPGYTSAKGFKPIAFGILILGFESRAMIFSNL